ncbi:hypothetical protein RN001_008979 [Aquatica leii]|uniref:CUB domain-containing protein n=1 Tax=Aquatica leii TaxID=1421715 RepID=A0AAN7QJC9_9COLE|nr:hypothetical protein RN001_008979 [Aquatica leii]
MLRENRGPGPPWGMFLISISFLLGISTLSTAEKSKYYSMQALCKNHFLQQVYRKIDGALLWSQNERNLDCVVTFQTHSILQRFMLRFDFLQLDCNDHLYIYDGAHPVGTYKSDLTCKNTKQKLGVMFTNTNYVTLKYVTDGWGTDSNGFKLVITAVKDIKHTCTEYQCKLRKLCIATDLLCDGINHCGDGSDESSNTLCQNNESGPILGLEVTGFVVVVVSILLVLLFLIAAVAICICRRGANARPRNTTQQQNASYSLQQMYGSNGAMKQQGSMTTLPIQGNWCHPAGPLGFRISTPPRARLYCLAK